MNQASNRLANKEFSDTEYSDFRQFLQDCCGIDLGLGKEYLVATRIRKILAQEHIGSLAKLLNLLKQPNQQSLLQEVIDAMTTNETLWFRDAYPFDYLASSYLPSLPHSSGGALRVWSAACSYGQEPYSIKMIVDEFNTRQSGTPPVTVNITASDISAAVLAKAKKGVYDRLSVTRGLSDFRLKKYFTPQENDQWQVKPSIQQGITFEHVNLQRDDFGCAKYQIIFCRNVLIYFNAELKAHILKKLHRSLTAGGLLFLGASESVSGAEDLFAMINCEPGIAYLKR